MEIPKTCRDCEHCMVGHPLCGLARAHGFRVGVHRTTAPPDACPKRQEATPVVTDPALAHFQRRERFLWALAELSQLHGVWIHGGTLTYGEEADGTRYQADLERTTAPLGLWRPQ